MKYILVIGDGMSDDAVPSLGGLYPLQKAVKPTIDALASRGVLGRAVNCPEGLPAGSDTAILSIFGCDPRQCYTGRAPLEAAAQGVALKAGDLAFRCNMASIEENDAVPFAERKIVSHSAGSIDGESSKALVEALFADPAFRAAADKAGVQIYPTLSYRHIAVQSGGDGKGLALKPPHDHLGEAVGQNLPSGNANAEVLTELMRLSNEFLTRHPINVQRRAEGKLAANCAWFWAEGTAVELPSFDAHYHKRGAVISAVPLCHGIATLTGLDVVKVEGATGELDTNYEGKAAAALQALADGYDFVAVHLEAPDECTHNFDLPGKIQAIENLDSRIVKPIVDGLEATGTAFRLLLLSDHRTYIATGAHGAAPVPFIVYDSRTPTQGEERCYCEPDSERGPFVADGVHLLGILFEQEHF